MSVVIVEMSEMSDSKELYDSKPPAACIAFLYTTVALCVAIFIWITTGEINVIIRGNAIVTTYENQDTRTLENKQEYWLEIPVSSCDIQWVETGMKVRCSLEALPDSEYGFVKGEIIEISNELYIGNDGLGYYIVKARLDSTELTGSNGKSVSLQNQMRGNALIQAGTQRVLKYLQKCMN